MSKEYLDDDEIYLLTFLRDQILSNFSDLRQAFQNIKLTNIPRNLFTEIVYHVQALKDRIDRIIRIGDRSQIVKQTENQVCKYKPQKRSLKNI